jgi:hypothetical protein
MTPRAKTRPSTRPKPLDPRAVAEAAVDQAIGDARVADRKRDLAIARHTAAVTAAGGPVDLDWYTRQLIHPVRGVVS